MTGAERAAFLEALRGPSISPADPSMRQHVELMAMQRARDEALDRAAPILGNADL